MTKTTLKAKALLSHFEKDGGEMFLADFAENFPWASADVIEAAQGFSYD